ncbi:MAG: hypothetical protein Q8Q82_13920 [Hydrogenophaga sp.]|nr:hypothetical protein [Hydrogenophaga sp.]
MVSTSDAMQTAPHYPYLKRTGLALLALGLIDIAVLIYCIAHRISYSSSFNIFAVIAGVLLLRGSLRTASAVRWLSAFMGAAFVAMLFVWPLVQPWELTFLQIRLSPFQSLFTLLIFILMVALLAWLYHQLGNQAVLDARSAAGRRARDMRIPAAIGVGMVVLLAAALPMLLEGDSGRKAKELAQQQLGTGYKYHVSSLRISKTSQSTSVAAAVTAWNSEEVRTVPVSWQE